MRRSWRGKSWLDPHPRPLLPRPGLELGAQLALNLGRETGTHSCLVVFLLWEKVEGEDVHFRVLQPSATLPRTDRPVEAGAVEINICLLASCVCSVMIPGLAPLFSSLQMFFPAAPPPCHVPR